jgi:hypothetical protein
MPAYTWKTDPQKAVVDAVEKASREAGALAMWASWAVDAIYYVIDAEDAIAKENNRGHSVWTIDITNARTATGSAMTALDLCAAAIGHLHGVVPPPPKKAAADQKEHDLASLRLDARYASLPPDARQWCDDTFTHSEYQLLAEARNGFVHRKFRRTLAVGGGKRATSYQLQGGPVAHPNLLRLARDFTTSRVEEWFKLASGGRL